MGAHRRFGILTGLAAVCWGLALALVLVAAATGLFMVLLGASEALTPSPTGERDARLGLGVLLASAVGAVALGLLTLVLAAVVTVLSLRRLRGDAHGRAVPVPSLAAAGLSVVAPAAPGGPRCRAWPRRCGGCCWARCSPSRPVHGSPSCSAVSSPL